MRKLYDRLTGAVKHMKDKIVAKFHSAMTRATLRSAWMLRLFYNRWTPKVLGPPLRRGRVRSFLSKTWFTVAWLAWTAVIMVLVVLDLPIQGLKKMLRAAGVLLGFLAVYGGAASYLVAGHLMGLRLWLNNLIGHVLVTGWLKVWRWAIRSEDEEVPTQYLTFRSCTAYALAALMTFGAGPAKLFEPLIGPRHLRGIVRRSVALVGWWDADVRNWYYNDDLPYGVEPEQAMIVVFDRDDIFDLPVEERDKVANFFRSSGFVLISEISKEPCTPEEIFNEYALSRWAELEAEEVGTDEYGRTWAKPYVDRPLLKVRNVALSTPERRLHADEELDWMSEEDTVRRSYGYGRHWAAALIDMYGDSFLDSQEKQARERAMLHSKLKGHDTGILVEHAVRGYADKLHEVLSERTKI